MTLPQTPFRVLYVEDDPRHRELTRESLERRGPFVVDFAEDIKQANQHVATTPYDAVLVDIGLDLTEASGKQGDDWLFDNLKHLGSAFVAVVTAQKPRLRNAAWLHDHNISVVEKGQDEVELYDRLARRVSPGREEVARSEVTETSEMAVDMLTQKTLSLFADWVDKLPDADLKDVWFGGQWLSPRDVQREMAEPRSTIGREMASLFLDHLRAALGLDSGEQK
jgi:CheY-like chemotaxis protein